jgi:CoA:oxalate CoA-transferase
MFIQIDSPQGKNMEAGIAIKLSDTPGNIRKPAPTIGQHSEEVLKEFGYSDESIKDLQASGADYLYEAGE